MESYYRETAKWLLEKNEPSTMRYKIEYQDVEIKKQSTTRFEGISFPETTLWQKFKYRIKKLFKKKHDNEDTVTHTPNIEDMHYESWGPGPDEIEPCYSAAEITFSINDTIFGECTGILYNRISPQQAFYMSNNYAESNMILERPVTIVLDYNIFNSMDFIDRLKSGEANITITYKDDYDNSNSQSIIGCVLIEDMYKMGIGDIISSGRVILAAQAITIMH